MPPTYIRYSINLAVKKICSCRIPQSLKKSSFRCMAILSMHRIVEKIQWWCFIRSSQVTNHGSVVMSPKQSNSPPCGSLNPSQIERKVFVGKSLRSKWWPVSSAKLVMWQLFHLSIVGRSIPSGTPQFVCIDSSEKFEKRTREDESLFTMTMRALTHRLKPAFF